MKTQWRVWTAMGAMLAVLSGAAFAEEAGGDRHRQGKRERLEELQRLKQEDPQKFQEIVSRRKTEIRNKMQKLKEEDPEKFEQMKGEFVERRREKLKKLREENPEKFREIMEQKQQRLAELKENEPEKYRKFIENHPKAAKRLERRKSAVIKADEKDLARQAQAGDIDSYSALVDLYKERAVRTAYTLTGNLEDARDLAQDAFVKAYENIGSFKSESRFYTWFYRILSNTCKDFLRKKKVRGAISFWVKRDEEAEGPSPEELIPDTAKNAAQQSLNRELSDELYRAMEKLPFQQKSAFCLRYLEGLSLDEVAESMELSVGTVKAHLWQAAAKMRKYLGPYVQGEVV